MNAFVIVKTVSGMIAGAGVGTVVGNVVKVTTPIGINIGEKVLTKIGGFCISYILGSIAGQQVENAFDAVKLAIETAKKTQSM